MINRSQSQWSHCLVRHGLNTETRPNMVRINSLMVSGKWFSLEMKRDMKNNTSFLPLDVVLSTVTSEAVAPIR